MATASPYRSAPSKVGKPLRGVSFLPRPYLFIAPLVLLAALTAVRLVPRRLRVVDAGIACTDRVAAAATLGRERHDTPILTCWCDATRLTRTLPDRLARFGCEQASSRVSEYLLWDGDGGTLTFREEPGTIVPHEEVSERAAACGKGGPPGRCNFHYLVRFAGLAPSSDLTILRVLVAVATTLAALFGKRVRVRADTALRLVQVRESSLLGRARETRCALEQIRSIVDHPSGFAFLLADGTYFPLTEQDHRSGFLRARTLARLEGLLADARAADPHA
jgi:hypothetical protein